MAHYVKCYCCGETFNRDKVECVQKGRRYAHINCAKEADDKLSQEEKDLKDLEAYILNLFKIESLTTKINKQIKLFKEKNNYTYSGMLKTLKWYYDIKNNSTEKANGGIGIVPYIYEEACNYYYKLYLAQLINEDKDVSEYLEKDIIEVEIKAPTPQRKGIKLFDLGGE